MKSEFKERWRAKEQALGYEDFLKAELLAYKGVFLPKDSSPFVSFSVLEDKSPQSEYYGGAIDSEEYTLIGMDGCGSPVCEEISTGKIYLLDHNDGFSVSCFLNDSVELLAECLLVFMGEDCAEKAFKNIQEIDPEAINAGCFWCEEISELEEDV